MLYLKSNGQRVWFWETFQAMRWPSKLMGATMVLPPVFAILVARLESGEERGSRVFWMIVAAICGLACAMTLSQYVRGWFAQRRGVPPEPYAYTPNSRQPRWLLIWVGAVGGLLTLELVSHIGRHPDKQTEKLALTFYCLFFILLSGYSRSRPADESPDLTLRVTPGRQTPASPLPPSPFRPA